MKGPVDPRLLRHARGARLGVAGLALIGTAQAGTALLVAFALTAAIAGRSTAGIVALALAYPVRAALAWAEQVVAQRTAARVTDELRRSALAAALRRGPAWVARYGSGRLTAALTTGLDAMRPWFGGYLPALILGVALPPLVVVAMALVDPASALITVVTLPLVPVLGALIGWATQARAKARWAEDARLAGHFLDVVRGLATLRVFGRAARQAGVVAEMTDRHRAATMRVLRVAFLSSTALDLLGTLSVGLIAVGAGLRVAAGEMPLGPALLVILLAPEAYRPLRESAARYHASAASTAVMDDLDEVLAASPAGLAPPSADRVSVAAFGLRVRHPDASRDALRLSRLDARGGEMVALRGPSGAGKTTALRVLAGMQRLDAGSVSVSGPPPLYLPQRPLLPHARTVADVAGAAALRLVGLSLAPETPLGEHGRGVSAGQRQRLALAAVLAEARREPRVLLLDEPTAHLDPAAEERVIAELRRAAARGCAVVVVAHRPALLAAADRVVDVAAPPRDPDVVHSRRPEMSEPAASVGPTQCRGGGGGGGRDATVDLRGAGVAAVALGAASWLAGIVLTGAAAWLLVRAAELPPVLTLSAAVVLVRGSAVARPLLRYAERLVSHQVAFARLGVRRAAVYAGLVPRVPGPRVRRRGELLTRVVDDVDADVDGLLRGVLPAAAALVAAVVAAAVVAAVRPVAGVPLVAGLVVAGLVAPALGVWLEARREAVTGRARAEMRDAVVETVDGLEEVRSPAVPEERSRVLARAEARAARGAGVATALGHLGWGVAVVGAALLLTPGGGLDREWAAVLLLGIVALAEPVAVLPDAALAHRRAAAARRRLADLTDDPPPARERTTVGAEPVDGGVRIRGLTAGWERPAFRNLRLDIPAGGATVVLGPSGSGKSTLAAVLAGFLDPAAGSVTIGGAALGALGEDVLRRAVVLVGDETEHVFASTVRENLRLARPGATDAELERVLQRVGLDGWGKTLDTRLGSGGSTLSGGQRKRLATARALLADPLLLILDEPTEGLDSDGAEALMTDLLTAADDRAVLVLTHRTDGLQRVPRGRVHVIGDLVVPVPDGQRPGRLEHQDRGAGVGDRLVLGTARDHEDAALRQGDAAVPQLDGQGAVQDQEELVGVVVGVPDVFAVHLGDADVVVVDAGDDARAPQLVERGQRVGE